MAIQIREVQGKKDMKTFIYLPEKIHADHKTWVHPIYIEEWAYFDPKKNRSFAHSDTILAIAWHGDKPVGRIMGIINKMYNKIANENNARFYGLECYKDIEIARALLGFIENWAKEKGCDKLVGPLGFSDKDPQGCMIEGHDQRVTITSNHSFPWMKDFYEELGFETEIDMVSLLAPIPEEMPAYIDRVAERVMRNTGFKLLEFTSRKKMKPWIVPIFRLVNETFKDIYGFVPMDEKEMQEMAGRYLPILNPRFVKIVTNPEDQPIAFMVMMPEISEGIRKARGRLLPFGWYHILRESKKTKMITSLLGAIREDYRGRGIDMLMGLKVVASCQKAGMKFMDSHLILETNKNMIAEYVRFKGEVHKRFRVFYKNLK